MGSLEQSRSLGDPDMLTLGKVTQHSGERTLSGLGLERDQEHLASLDLGRSGRKGCQGSPERRTGRCPHAPDTTSSLTIAGRAQTSFIGTFQLGAWAPEAVCSTGHRLGRPG